MKNNLETDIKPADQLIPAVTTLDMVIVLMDSEIFSRHIRPALQEVPADLGFIGNCQTLETPNRKL